MKTKKLLKKLMLNKKTIVDLNSEKMMRIKGGLSLGCTVSCKSECATEPITECYGCTFNGCPGTYTCLC